MRVWRICPERHVATVFSGEGARRFGARWNPVGVPMVYTSLSLSLAVVEIFVHLEIAAEPDDLWAVAAELPVAESEADRVSITDLPKDWREMNQLKLRAIGSDWALSRRSLVLLVPSVAVEGEWNALVNPEHVDAKKIKIVDAKPFRIDPRMFSRGR
jgi:RES domain-containing protein